MGTPVGTPVGGADGPVGEPGDRRTAPRGMRGPLRGQGQRPSRAIREAIRPGLVVVAVGAPTRSAYSPECVEGQFSEVRMQDPARPGSYGATNALSATPP